jgi:hypothetical protein
MDVSERWLPTAKKAVTGLYSIGLAEIAVNQRRADADPGLAIGTPVGDHYLNDGRDPSEH